MLLAGAHPHHGRHGTGEQRIPVKLGALWAKPPRAVAVGKGDRSQGRGPLPPRLRPRATPSRYRWHRRCRPFRSRHPRRSCPRSPSARPPQESSVGAHRLCCCGGQPRSSSSSWGRRMGKWTAQSDRSWALISSANWASRLSSPVGNGAAHSVQLGLQGADARGGIQEMRGWSGSSTAGCGAGPGRARPRMAPQAGTEAYKGTEAHAGTVWRRRTVARRQRAQPSKVNRGHDRSVRSAMEPARSTVDPAPFSNPSAGWVSGL